MLKKSIIPFAIVALLAGVVGFGARQACPQARTLGGAVSCDQATAELLAD